MNMGHITALKDKDLNVFWVQWYMIQGSCLVFPIIPLGLLGVDDGCMCKGSLTKKKMFV